MTQKYRVILPQELDEIGDPILVSTFMRSGTHLTIDLLRRHFQVCRSWKLPLQPLDQLYLPVDVLLPDWEPADWSIPRVLQVLRRPTRPILKTHFLTPDFSNLASTQPHLANWLRQRASLIYVRRAPRPAIMSVWALLQSWKPEAPDGPDTAFVEKYFTRWQEHTQAWESAPNVLSLEFDRILSEPRAVLSQLARHLDESLQLKQPLLPRPLQNRFESRWQRLVGIRPPSTSILVPHAPPPWNPAWDHLIHE